VVFVARLLFEVDGDDEDDEPVRLVLTEDAEDERVELLLEVQEEDDPVDVQDLSESAEA